jgi:hypothetical protein
MGGRKRKRKKGTMIEGEREGGSGDEKVGEIERERKSERKSDHNVMYHDCVAQSKQHI